MQGPDLLVGRQASGPALLGLHHRVRGVAWWRHGRGEGPIGLRYRRLVSGVVERVELLDMGIEHLIEHLREILDQVKTIRHLNRRRRPLSCAIFIGFGAVSRDDLHARVGAEPLGERVGVSIIQERYRSPLLQVHQDRAIRVTFPERPVIDPKNRGRRKARQRQTAHHAQEGVPTHPQAPALAQTHTGLAPEGQAERDEALSQPQRAPGPGGRHGRQAFGEDAARAAPVDAEELPNLERSHDAEVCPRRSARVRS